MPTFPWGHAIRASQAFSNVLGEGFREMRSAEGDDSVVNMQHQIPTTHWNSRKKHASVESTHLTWPGVRCVRDGGFAGTARCGEAKRFASWMGSRQLLHLQLPSCSHDHFQHALPCQACSPSSCRINGWASAIPIPRDVSSRVSESFCGGSSMEVNRYFGEVFEMPQKICQLAMVRKRWSFDIWWCCERPYHACNPG